MSTKKRELNIYDSFGSTSKDQDQRRKMSFYLPEGITRQLKMMSIDKGTSYSNMITEMISAYLDNNSAPNLSHIEDSESNPSHIEDETIHSNIKLVTKTISVINNRLLDVFGKDPKVLHTIDPIFFERLVAELFEQEGYEVVLTPPRGDGGKDIYVRKQDPFTRSLYLVECKRYVPPNTVGVEIARQLYGVVQQERASGGIIVTTSYFTNPAKQFANLLPYQLILRDFDDLIAWIRKLSKLNVKGQP